VGVKAAGRDDTPRRRPDILGPRARLRPGPDAGGPPLLSRPGSTVAPAAALLVLGAAAPAGAGHSYTELYNPLYVVGVALVVVASFVVVALVVKRAVAAGWPTYDLLRLRVALALARPALGTALRVVSVLGLLLLDATGLFGSRIATWNIAPTLVWVVAWIMIPALQLLIGNVWGVDRHA
jgi:hypothetical protein